MAEVNMAEIDADSSKKSSTGMEPKIAVLISYIFSLVGGLIFWLIEKENKFVKWNALQAFITGIIIAIIAIIMAIFSWIPILGWIILVICWIAYIAILVVLIVAIVKAFQGNTYRIPGVCKLTDKYFKM